MVGVSRFPSVWVPGRRPQFPDLSSTRDWSSLEKAGDERKKGLGRGLMKYLIRIFTDTRRCRT